MAVYSDGRLTEVRAERIATTGDPCLELTREEIFRRLPEPATLLGALDRGL
ncbi:hypothetical protein SBA4_3580027 [Candidatus Sulfopaludibacter sp. SbA4]|nr:hypothetical protein SBA4_3580027 [Candidatus Sulfopaludibacter sp. SbA4]